jgi:hypothetical protein
MRFTVFLLIFSIGCIFAGSQLQLIRPAYASKCMMVMLVANGLVDDGYPDVCSESEGELGGNPDVYSCGSSPDGTENLCSAMETQVINTGHGSPSEPPSTPAGGTGGGGTGGGGTGALPPIITPPQKPFPDPTKLRCAANLVLCDTGCLGILGAAAPPTAGVSLAAGIVGCAYLCHWAASPECFQPGPHKPLRMINPNDIYSSPHEEP